MSYISHESIVESPRQKVFKALLKPSLYKKLVPKKLELTLVSPELLMKKGAEYEFRVSRWGLRQILSLRVEEFKENEEVVFVQSVGFFGRYKHIIRLGEHSENTTLLSHFVDYDLQFGLFGKLYDDLYLRRYLKLILETCSKQISSIIV